MDESGELLHSSLPIEAPRREHRLLAQAHKEAKSLFNSQFHASGGVRQVVVDKPGERCALIVLNGDYFSLSLFPFFGPIEGMMLDQYAALVEPIAKPSPDTIEFDKIKTEYRLSNRELDVLKALISGDTDKSIARALQLSVETVRAYLKTLRAKLGLTTRTAIVHFVYEYSPLKSAHKE
jgi:DNA-binding CsgD family transcriptional regulator